MRQMCHNAEVCQKRHMAVEKATRETAQRAQQRRDGTYEYDSGSAVGAWLCGAGDVLGGVFSKMFGGDGGSTAAGSSMGQNLTAGGGGTGTGAEEGEELLADPKKREAEAAADIHKLV